MSQKYFGYTEKELLQIIDSATREKLTNKAEGQSKIPFLSYVIEGIEEMRKDEKLSKELYDGVTLFLESNTP